MDNEEFWLITYTRVMKAGLSDPQTEAIDEHPASWFVKECKDRRKYGCADTILNHAMPISKFEYSAIGARHD